MRLSPIGYGGRGWKEEHVISSPFPPHQPQLKPMGNLLKYILTKWKAWRIFKSFTRHTGHNWRTKPMNFDDTPRLHAKSEHTILAQRGDMGVIRCSMSGAIGFS